jgi:transformer-2 protein
LGIFGLSGRTSERALRELYSQYGKVEECVIVVDRETNHSRGFGFVYFESLDSAERAREATNGMKLDERNIRVDYSVTKGPHSPTPGRYMGNVSSSRRYGSPRRDRRDYDRRDYDRRNDRRREYDRRDRRDYDRRDDRRDYDRRRDDRYYDSSSHRY